MVSILRPRRFYMINNRPVCGVCVLCVVCYVLCVLCRREPVRARARGTNLDYIRRRRLRQVQSSTTNARARIVRSSIVRSRRVVFIILIV